MCVVQIIGALLLVYTMAGPWHAGMSACWHVPIQWTHKPVSVSVFSIQPSRLSLSTDTDCTALVCSRGENLALLSRIRGNFVTFVQFVGNNQPLPLCLSSWLGAACRHGPGHSALWETGKCKTRIVKVTINTISSNEGSQRLHNHREGPYLG